MTQESTRHEGLPVAGYRPQSSANIAQVNAMKRVEEMLLRHLDAMKASDDIDQCWLAVGRTGIEQGFMAVNRSIFRPGRIDLPDAVEGAWLIEDAASPVSQPTYFHAGPEGPAFVEDSLAALRFSRKGDAEAFAIMSAGSLEGVRIAFHEWG